ncbi:MAG: ECF transporter S component [Lachnospiraceae bacterium]|nr:ECF transporter S component [Candidatus Minthocola equi]
MTKRKISTTQLCLDAMMAGIVALLGYIALDFGTIKITFESLPVLLAALMYGPVDGMLVGAVGTLIYQVLKYGLTVTTLLWMLPYIIIGLVAGLYASRKNYSNTKKQLLFIVIICQVLEWLLNTGVMIIDAKIYEYPYEITFVMALIRLGVAVIKGFIFGLLMPGVLIKLTRFTGNGQDAKRNYH